MSTDVEKHPGMRSMLCTCGHINGKSCSSLRERNRKSEAHGFDVEFLGQKSI